MQAMLGADVDASVAQDALRAVIDRMDVAVEASLGLLARVAAVKVDSTSVMPLRRSSGTSGISAMLLLVVIDHLGTCRWAFPRSSHASAAGRAACRAGRRRSRARRACRAART